MTRHRFLEIGVPAFFAVVGAVEAVRELLRIGRLLRVTT